MIHANELFMRGVHLEGKDFLISLDEDSSWLIKANQISLP